MPTTITLGLATFRRERQLRLLLGDLLRQTRLPDEVVIVDNDAKGSARATVEGLLAEGCPFPVRYEVQPVQSIAITRNRTVAMARCELFASLDDDERVSADWLQTMLDALLTHSADGVLGPVVYSFPPGVPEHIKLNEIFERRRFASGSAPARDCYRFGNVLLKSAWLQKYEAPFDLRYGLTGGEDGDFLCRIAEAGANIVWCNEAEVFEPVEQNRTEPQWLRLRSLRGGQDYARHWRAGRYGAKSSLQIAGFLAQGSLQLLVACLMVLLTLPAGAKAGLYWQVKLAANLGKLSVWGGWHYREYADTPAAQGKA